MNCSHLLARSLSSKVARLAVCLGLSLAGTRATAVTFMNYTVGVGGTTQDFQWSGYAAENRPAGVGSGFAGQSGQWGTGIGTTTSQPGAFYSTNPGFTAETTDFIAAASGGGIYNFMSETHYRMSVANPEAGLKSLFLQISWAEGVASNFVTAPTLTINTALGSQTLAATYSQLLGQQSVTIFGPTLLDLSGYQWDLSSITSPITSYSVDWQMPQHSIMYAQDITESTRAATSNLLSTPEPSRAVFGMIGLLATALRRRRPIRVKASAKPRRATLSRNLDSFVEAMPRRAGLRAAFTLIELLVTITIVGILATLVVGGYGLVTQHARMAEEIAAAKTLVSAYSAYSVDNNGRLMPGYDRTIGEVRLPSGDTVGGPTAQRYPYRLAPYFDYKMQGTILVNGNATKIQEADTYMVSCFPALGMNYIYVGGDYSAQGELTFAGECITELGQAKSSTLVFASAGSSGGDSPTGSSSGKMEGYCTLTPPQESGPMWQGAKWTKNSAPEDYGHVDARYNGKAVCAFLDGSVRALTIDDLRDMRLWSSKAAAANNPDYTVAREMGTGRPTRR